jgi:hypothetical protein
MTSIARAKNSYFNEIPLRSPRIRKGAERWSAPLPFVGLRFGPVSGCFWR